jgi:hypothetical protein
MEPRSPDEPNGPAWRLPETNPTGLPGARRNEPDFLGPRSPNEANSTPDQRRVNRFGIEAIGEWG